MATGDKFGRMINRLGWRHMNAFMGPTNSNQQLFFYPNSVDTVYVREDFTGTNFANSGLSTGVTAAGAGAVFANGTGAGTIFGGAATGALTATSVITSLTGPNIWTAGKNCGMHARISMSSNTNINFEVGFVDVSTSSVSMAISDIDVPTFGNGATNAALVSMDTSQTLKTMALCVTGSQASGSATSAAIGTLTPTGSVTSWMDIVVQTIFQDATHADVVTLINNSPANTTFLGSTTAKQINSAAALMPWIAVQEVTTANTTLKFNVELFECWMDR